MRWPRKRMDLAERLRPYINTGPPPEPMVDADPIRMFLVRWMIETGDPINVVARGFDVDSELLGALLERRIRQLRTSEALAVSTRLGLEDGAVQP